MRIMILDNDKALIRSIEIILQSDEHDIFSFSNIDDAIAFIETCDPIDLLLVDFLMPRMTGFDFLHLIEKHRGKVQRIVMMSGHTDLIEKRELEVFGVSSFLSKPICMTSLKRLVDMPTLRRKPR